MIRRVNESNLASVRTFLEAHVETSVFLLSCLSHFGPSKGDNPNSGDYRVIEEDGQIVGVFSLTRRGHLLAQTGGRAHLAEAILLDCLHEPVGIQAVVAEWRVADPLWVALCSSSAFQSHYATKNVVYRLGLHPGSMPEEYDPRVRMLGAEDFDQWDAHNSSFVAEEGAPSQGTRDQRRATFGRRSAAGCWWGAFDGADLISTAALDECCSGVGQIAGVYTRPLYRRQGFARAVMMGIVRAGTRAHSLHTVVLFANEPNLAARSFYESIGFAPVGFFGMLFGERLCAEPLDPVFRQGDRRTREGAGHRVDGPPLSL